MQKHLSRILIFVLFFSFSTVMAQDGAPDEKFDISGMIMHHIGDEHGYEITKGVKIPLPVILYTRGEGLQVFSSSKVDDGKVYNGYRNDHETIVKVDASGNIDKNTVIYDFSITKNVFFIILSSLLLILIFVKVAKGYKTNKGKAPKGIQALMEPIVVFLRDDVAKPVIGDKKYERFFPFILTIFFFVLINNLLGLTPLAPNVTGNIAVTMVMALFTFVITHLVSNRHYWKEIFLPDTPKWMYPIMIPVELVGVIMKPASLMIRLFANITAGHIIMLSLYGMIFIFKSYMVGGGVTFFALFMSLIEILVAFVQALIFALLSAMYIGMAVTDGHE